MSEKMDKRRSPKAGVFVIWILAFGISPTLAWGEPAAYFTEVGNQAGLTFRHVHGGTGRRYYIETMGPGIAFLDYDGDGNLDIYAVNGQYTEGDRSAPPTPQSPVSSLQPLTNVLYRNNGDGTFVDVTQEAGVGDTGYGVGVTAADYDNDGDLDIYVTNYGPNVLYRNNGDGTFVDVTREAGVRDPRWGVGCAFLDYDGDGYLDLYVANYVDFSLEVRAEALTPYMAPGGRIRKDVTAYPHPDNFRGASDVLYRNNGDGTFVDVTREADVFNPAGKGMGMACGDYDNDGDVDIYVANDRTPNFLYRNNGDGTFVDVALMAGVGYNEDGKTESSMGVDFGDYDNDGQLDLIVPNFQGETCTLYRNEGYGAFGDVSISSGIGAPTRPYVGWGAGFLDYDNDGDLDLFIATGHVLDNVELFDASTSYPQRNFLFRNEGPDGRYAFTDISAQAGPGLALVKPSRGTAFGDYDRDGDVDILVINCNDSISLLRNDGNDLGHWLQVRTVGTRSNRDGIGARITVTAGDRVQIREIKSGSSLYSQSDLWAHFGLGDRTRVDRMEIRWPSGMRQVMEDVAVDQVVTVYEGGD